MSVLAWTAAAFLLRYLVSLHPYSGMNTPPMYGDYEAQRHWMEITINLPPTQWYRNSTSNNLQYWGLDYPPLQAYHAWLCGSVAQLFDPVMVALESSHGYETPFSKLFMRWTALVSDALTLFPAAVTYVPRLFSSWPKEVHKMTIVVLLLQPAFVVIDHGHFQYNNFALGLVLAAIGSIGEQAYLQGAVFFVLALGFKQTTLFFALPFFFYLLSRTIRQSYGILRLISLGVTVIITAVVVFFPFLHPHDLAHVLQRMFPWERGLFEDKVSNFWCAISPVIKLKQLYSINDLRRMAMLSTLAASLPANLRLMRHNPNGGMWLLQFLYALFNTTLAFYMFSYQVHEKAILMAVLPACLLLPRHPVAVTWFSLVASFSLHTLMFKDRLTLAYLACTLIFAVVCFAYLHVRPNWAMLLSIVGMVAIHVGERVVVPPANLPDLWPLLSAIYCAVHFLGFLIAFNYWQHKADTPCCCTFGAAPEGKRPKLKNK